MTSRNVSPLSALLDEDARSLCRGKIESLEHWLRRLVDEVMTATHGADYATRTDASGKPVLAKKRIEPARARMLSDPARYPRLLDAMLLGDLIDIVCGNEWPNFRPALQDAYPHGPAEARTFLTRIEGPRNNLSHANSVSLRAMEQVLCYSNDVIDALKDHYRRAGMQTQYDIPYILAVRDFRGRTWRRSELLDNSGPLLLHLNKDPAYFLRPGDELAFEVEVDPSFTSAGYSLRWHWPGVHFVDSPSTSRVVVPIEERHVMEQFMLSCQVTTDRVWHRLQGCDEHLVLVLKVLPP